MLEVKEYPEEDGLVTYTFHVKKPINWFVGEINLRGVTKEALVKIQGKSDLIKQKLEELIKAIYE